MRSIVGQSVKYDFLAFGEKIKKKKKWLITNAHILPQKE
jgi:hypothetical protein